MYIDTSHSHQHGKIYTRYLLRENYRENGKVKHRTIANLSACSAEEIEAIKLALKHKQNLTELSTQGISVQTQQGLSIGTVGLLFQITKELGIQEALGKDKQAKLALWQIMARIIDQGSRLSAVRLAQHHAVEAVLKLEKFNENDLYQNLDWLTEHQTKIEDRLFRSLKTQDSHLFLYDVTSSYLEGTCNELAAFGYNRDGKKGKLQIVLGLLCNENGIPISIEVFQGNTIDTKTLSNQIQKAAKRFGIKQATFVGDRGMIKSAGIKELQDNTFSYITAITKPQIQALLKEGLFQIELFDESIGEIIDESGIRYILHRNPVRAEEVEQSRQDKWTVLQKLVTEQNQYLEMHKRSKAETALKKVTEKAKQLRIEDWVVSSLENRLIKIQKDDVVLQKKKELDGCYVLKTNVPSDIASKKTIHDRYKDLALVEKAFRNSKTVFLNLRPLYVRLESRTRGHALVIMLAYRIIQELSKRWKDLDLTVEEGIQALNSLCVTEVQLQDRLYYQIPKPRDLVDDLLKAAKIILPDILPGSTERMNQVATKKKLQKHRKAS